MEKCWRYPCRAQIQGGHPPVTSESDLTSWNDIQGGFFDCSALKMTKYKEK